MGERVISQKKVDELRETFREVPVKELVKKWEISDPRLKAARKQHQVTDDEDIMLFGHRIRRIPEGMGVGLLVRVTNQHAGSLKRKVDEKVEKTNITRKKAASDEPTNQEGGLMSKSSSEKVGQHSSLTINPNSSEQALELGKKIEDDLHRKKQPQEYEFRAVEAYAIGKKAMVMVEEKGVDLQYFYAAILERQSEKKSGGESTGVGNFLRKNGVNPNVSNEIMEGWAEKTTPTAIYGIMSELENLGINRMDLFLTGFKDGRAQIVHLMDENRKEDFKPLPAELVDRMRNALGKRRGGMDDTSFRRLEPIIERVRWDEKNFDVARTFPTFRVTVLKVDGGDAKGKIEAINRAVKKFNRENTLPYFELSPTNAHDLGDNLAVMPRTLAVSLQELEMGGSTYSNYINSVLKHNEIKREDVEAARKLLDEKFRIKYEGETYALDSDQFTFAQVSRGRLVMVPKIELGQKIG